jgi:integrase
MIARHQPKRKRASANRKPFNERNVHKIPRKNHQYLIWDEGTGAARGLAILVSPTGTKSYRVVFYFPGSSKPYYKNIGRVGEMSLEDARQAAWDARAMAKRGEDPRAGEANKSDTFKVAVADYIQHEQIGRHQNRSALETQQVMLASCGVWLTRPVATIRYQEIDKLLELLRDGNAELKPRPYLANRLYSHLKDFFGWCVRKKKIAVSPMGDMEKPWNGATPRTRDWFKGKAADKAITAVWKAADQIGGDGGRYLKLMLLTGKRKTALASMRWEDIDAYWFWHAPRSRAKNKRLHPIPLPKKAQEVLHPRRENGFVFQGVNPSDAAIVVNSKDVVIDEKVDLRTVSRAILGRKVVVSFQRWALERLQHEIRKASGLEDFFFHGVRHLLESKLAELKVAPHIRDLLFDHVPNRGTGAGYDHYEYRDEMLAALNQWAEHIEKLRQPAAGVAVLR